MLGHSCLLQTDSWDRQQVGHDEAVDAWIQPGSAVLLDLVTDLRENLRKMRPKESVTNSHFFNHQLGVVCLCATS